MSQSPIDDFSAPAVAVYKQGWRALSRLLREDRSFSGRERNCAFLNTGSDQASFADVSALTGFGFADDGRGLATADWDFDGDLDVWITNRNAPRVRFLANSSPPAKRFIAFKLQGDGKRTNRDAIGARLELFLEGVEPAKRIRTLRGGEGFISQSSKWIHFGIGDAGGIAKLVVKWPGGTAEEFTALKPGGFYHVVQGSGAADPFSPPVQRAPIAASEQVVLASTENTRTIAPAGLPMPPLMVIGDDGSSTNHPLSTTQPTVINIWSSSCAPCLAELAEWSAHQKELLAAGVDVLTLSTDHLSGETAASETLAALKKTGSTFTNLSISEASLKSLDYLQRSVLDRWLPLPVPSTFLVSPTGEMIAFYKGPVSTSQLIQDLPLAGADVSPEARRNAAIPFRGRWLGRPVPGQANRVASIMSDHNEIELAAAYLERCAALLETRAIDENTKRDLGDIYYMAGLFNGLNKERRAIAIEQLSRARDLIPTDVRIRMELGRQLLAAAKPREALGEFTVASQITPSDVRLRMDLGMLHFNLGEFEKSKEIYGVILTADPQNAIARYHLANTEVRTKQFPQAIDSYRKVLTGAPRLLEAANNLAWILAAHPDEKLRSPDEALAITTRLCDMTKEKTPQFLDSHSVALANAGKFPEAIEAANKALALLPPEGKAAADALRGRMKLYEAGQPFREAGW